MEPSASLAFGVDESSTGSRPTSDHGAKWMDSEELLMDLREEDKRVRKGPGWTILVMKQGTILRLEVHVDTDVARDAAISYISLTLSPSVETDCISSFLDKFHTLRKFTQKHSDSEKHLVALLSSLHCLSGVTQVVLGVRCLTYRWVAKILAFIQNCPTSSDLHHLRLQKQHKGESLFSHIFDKRGGQLQKRPTNFDVFLHELYKQRYFRERDLKHEGSLLVSVLLLPGLKEVDLKVDCLTVMWAGLILCLIHRCSSLEKLIVTEDEWGLHDEKQTFCSTLRVQKESNSFRLDLDIARHKAADSAISNISLMHSSDVSSSSDLINFLKRYGIMRRRGEKSPKFDEHVDALLSSLASLSGLEVMTLHVRCLTVSWAARILVLFTKCPTLKEVQLVEVEPELRKYKQWLPEVRGPTLGRLCSSLSVKKHGSSLNITLDTTLDSAESHISFNLSLSSDVEYTDFQAFLQKLYDLKCLSEQSKEHLNNLRSFLHFSPGVEEVGLDFTYMTDWAMIIQSLIHSSTNPHRAQQDSPAEHQSNLRRSCQSCAGIPDSTHWALMDPSISMETGVSVYCLSSPAGSYECRVSGLRWVCAAEVTLQYHFCTEEQFSAQLELLQYRPISPLMDIKVLSGELEEVHLPHSLCLGLGLSDHSKIRDAVRVLHGDDSGVTLEMCELMPFHARIVRPCFSLKEVLVSLGVPVKTHCEVLIYQSYAGPLILNTFVVPKESTAKKAIEEEWKNLGIRIKKSPPNQSFWINSNFQLATSCPSKILPEEISLTYNTSPAYFEVCIRGPDDEFEMELKVAEEDRLIWTAAIRKGADYKQTMPPGAAEQPRASAVPIGAETLPVLSPVTAEGASQMSAPAVSSNSVQGNLVVHNTFLTNPPSAESMDM
ncbi:uncharacterized protein LOC134063064 isoform X5 [Sardina pilchardus]|uniref:uncharacterized protein LOC134063064 isoform X5 n=1 Tax=Sardina pilchardus TaxID=27697 RepID=UPI002E118381